MYKTVLPGTLPETLTIEKAGAFVVLKQHPHKLKLAEDITDWLLEALKKADPKTGSPASDSIGVIEVIPSADGVDIVSVSSTFHLRTEGYEELVKWLEAHAR